MKYGQHFFIWVYALLWEIYDWIFLDWSLMPNITNLQLYFSMVFIYLEKVVLIYLFIVGLNYLGGKTNE